VAPSVPPRRRPRVQRLADAALALLAVGLEAANLAPASLRQYAELFDVERIARPGVTAVAALVVIALPVLWRRQAPLTALAAVSVASAVLGTWLVLPLSWWASWPVLTVVAARLGPRASLAVTAAVTAAALATLAASGYDDGSGVALWYPAWFLVPWGLGLRQRAARLREERHDAQVRERSLRALADERSRVARELHDVLERSLDAMVDRAGVARALLPTDRAAAAAALAQVEGTGRAGMAEVRRLLAVLRDTEADRSPQPGLGRLDELVEAARRAGTPVTVRTVAFHPPADPSVDVFAYRIVEEALANAARHAPGSPVTVVLGGGDRRLTLEIVDRGPRRPGPGPAAAGRGLAAMRERAELVGGTLRAGPTRRGFAVRAELPLEPG
jgi:signal transduction histidine kinase